MRIPHTLPRAARLPSLLVAALLAALPFLLPLQSCERACEDSENCKRTCSCLNKETDERADCTMAFICDGETQLCESDYNNLTCDEICSQYAARAQCGRERCTIDAECKKVLSCDVVINGQPNPEQQFACTINFTCDQGDGLCQVESTLSDAQLCASATCRQQQGF
jgi:hypothetical protein